MPLKNAINAHFLSFGIFQIHSSFCRAKPLEFYLDQPSNGDRWGGETGSTTVKYKFCIIWNRSHAGEFEIPWITLQTFSVHPDSCPFLSVFFSIREWSFPTLLESLFSFKTCMKTLFFFSTWLYRKEVLAEIRELFWEEKKPFSLSFLSYLFLRLKLSFSVL